jgi:hypothetical protein
MGEAFWPAPLWLVCDPPPGVCSLPFDVVVHAIGSYWVKAEVGFS